MHSKTENQVHQPAILLVDDDPAVILALRKALGSLGTLHFATDGAQAIRLAREVHPDLVVLDAEMPGTTGLRVCETLRDDPELADVPVIFVTQRGDQEIEQAAFEAGAVDFITKPLSLPIVAMRAKTHLRLRATSQRLRNLASTDVLTGLANRRAFEESAQREWKAAQRNGVPVSLLMIDIDGFMGLNERLGHARGDERVRDVAGVLSTTLRRSVDLLARYDGERFAAILPNTDAAGALLVAGRMLRDVAGAKLKGEDGAHLTVSIGASSLDVTCDAWQWVGKRGRYTTDGAPSARDLVDAAALALLTARRSGRGMQSFRNVDAAIERRLAAASA